MSAAIVVPKCEPAFRVARRERERFFEISTTSPIFVLSRPNAHGRVPELTYFRGKEQSAVRAQD